MHRARRAEDNDEDQMPRRQRRRLMPQDDTAGGRQSAAVVNAQAKADTEQNEAEDEPHQHVDGQQPDSADEDEEEEEEGEEEDDEDEEYETEEERRLGQALLRDLGALEEVEDEDDDDAGWGHEEDQEEDEDEEYDEMDPYLDAGGAGMFIIPGGADYDIVVGMPHEHAARAAGSVPQVNPATDTQIASGVYAREEADGRHCLFGTPLRFVPKLLDRVFHMKQQSRQLLWKSSFELSDREWSYIKEVLSHERLRPLLQHGERVLKPLPESGFPERLRPKDSSGTPMRGPYVSKNTAKPWNVGRQYFSAFKGNDFSSFMWADGVMAMEAEAQESFNEYMDDDGGVFGLFF